MARTIIHGARTLWCRFRWLEHALASGCLGLQTVGCSACHGWIERYFASSRLNSSLKAGAFLALFRHDHSPNDKVRYPCQASPGLFWLACVTGIASCDVPGSLLKDALLQVIASRFPSLVLGPCRCRLPTLPFRHPLVRKNHGHVQIGSHLPPVFM